MGKARTTGQWAPESDRLVAYADFPAEISGRTVWKVDDLTRDRRAWKHTWTDGQILSLERAAAVFRQSGLSLADIGPDSFPLEALTGLIANIKDEIINGRGFILFKGLPVDRWDRETTVIVYLGLGSYFGNLVTQNGRGHLLGHVKDLGEDSKQIDKVRIYRTNARQYFHTDDCDIVGLLCLAKADQGGESDIISSHHLYNVLQKEHPDVLKTLIDEDWYLDRKGEISPGQEEWFKSRIINWIRGDHSSHIYTKWDPYYVWSLDRFWERGLVPKITREQERALQVVEEICLRESLHMILEVGDIQLLSNTHVMHARTAYVDKVAGPRRHLLRLWISTPESKGGWKLPYWDSAEPKRGGITIAGVEEKVVLEAE